MTSQYLLHNMCFTLLHFMKAYENSYIHSYRCVYYTSIYELRIHSRLYLQANSHRNKKKSENFQKLYRNVRSH